MDTVHLTLIAAAVGVALAGARMIYCGHRAGSPRDRRHADRRHWPRGRDRRTP